MSAPVLGIDPGHDGAAVLLAADGQRVLRAWAWRRIEVADCFMWRLNRSLDQERTVASLHEIAVNSIGDYCRAGVDPWALCIEGLFVHPDRTNGILELAEAVGEIKGPLAQCASAVIRPAPSQWRAAVLPRGWGRSSQDSERAALVVARAMKGLGLFVESELDGDGREVPLWPHVVEAACIARYGWVQQRGAAQMALIGGRR